MDAFGIKFNHSHEGKVEPEHDSVFQAMAYVYLSKQDARFTLCSECDRYFYIVDSKGFVFIYENSGSQMTSNQRIAQFDGFPLGAFLLKHDLYILTKDSILMIQINV